MSNDTTDQRGPETAPVTDWASDYDIFDPQYVSDPYGIWDELRESCPMAHSDRWGGSWLPTRYADVYAIAHDIEKFPSGNGISVVPMVDLGQGGAPAPAPVLASGVPPISADPPLHTWTRRLVLPTMSPARVAEYEVFTRELCRRLVDEVVATGEGDAASEYAQQIPVRVIGHILGVPEDMAATFTEWVRDVLEFAHDPERRRRGITGIITYLQGAIAEREADPKDDFITELLHVRARWRAGHRRCRHGDVCAAADRRHRHDLVVDRVHDVAPRHASRGSGPSDRRARPDADGDRGVPACLRAGDDGAATHRGHGVQRLPDQGR